MLRDMVGKLDNWLISNLLFHLDEPDNIFCSGCSNFSRKEDKEPTRKTGGMFLFIKKYTSLIAPNPEDSPIVPKNSNSFIEPIHRDVIKAAKEGDAQILRSLLQNNIPAHILINALCYSVSNAHLSCCRILLDKGVDINGVGLYGSTPLLTAAGRLNFEIADLLLKRGADVNARNDIGRTPLLVAILNFAEMDILCLLLEAGADANIADNRGLTPLWATLLDNRNPDILRLLLQYGADATMSYFGRLPIDIARKNNLKRFEQILVTTPSHEHKPDNHATP